MEYRSDRVSAAALQAFFNICAEWGLDDAQVRILLGNPSKPTFVQWKTDKSADTLGEMTIERISYLIGIAKALNQLLPTEAANNWIQKPNTAPMFNGRSALEKMLTGDIHDLADIRRYLEAECV